MGGSEQRPKIARVRGCDERFEMGANFFRFVRMLGQAVGYAFHSVLQICGRDCGGCLQISHCGCGVSYRQNARVKFEIARPRRLYLEFRAVVRAAGGAQFLRIAAS